MQEDRIAETALDWVASGRQVVLATVMQAWNAAPMRAGAQMLLDASGEVYGEFAAGVVAAEIAAAVPEVLSAGQGRVLDFAVSDGAAIARGLACGGDLRVLLLPIGGAQGLPVAILRDLVAARAARRAVALSVDLQSWQYRLLRPAQAGPELADWFRADRSGEMDGQFISLHNPPLKLVVIGAVRIAQALVPMARLAGWQVVLCDPRGAFAQAVRFPDMEIKAAPPDQVVAAEALDARSALVTLAHAPEIDDPALMAGLKSAAFYLGCLGSRRTHARRLGRLAAAGMGPDQLARLHGPAGLDIGAQSPAEIALSILAEMTVRLRKVP